MNDKDWEAGSGVNCLECGDETVRLLDGLCPWCWHSKETEQEEQLGRKREKRYLVNLFNKGEITLKQMREGRLS